MTFNGKRHTHIVDFDELANGTWDIENQQSIDDAVTAYINDANENEDNELSDVEIKRLRDFALYLTHRC